MPNVIVVASLIGVSLVGSSAAATTVGGGAQFMIVGGDKEIPTTDIDPEKVLAPAFLPLDEPPLKSSDPNLKPFLGIWRGQWDGRLDTYYVITAAEGTRVKVLKSWGTNQTVKLPGKRYIWGRIYDDKLVMIGELSTETLILTKDGNLHGVHYSPTLSEPSQTILVRSNPQN